MKMFPLLIMLLFKCFQSLIIFVTKFD